MVGKEGDFGRALVVRCVDFGSETRLIRRAGRLSVAISEVQLWLKLAGIQCDSALVGEGRLGGRFCGRRLVPKNRCRYEDVSFCENLGFSKGQNVFVVTVTTIPGKL